jgi:glycerophosphoryl diester phosphodiesterase
MEPRKRPVIISHRACMGHAPENTLAGIRVALDFGVDAIEVDVHTTADGVPVLLHDDKLDRTTDRTGDVRTMLLAEVRRADAGGEPVPKLTEALASTVGRAQLLIELKQAGIEARVVEAVRAADAQDWAAFCSFCATSVERLRELAPAIPTFALTQWRPDLMDPSQPNFVHSSLITEALVDRLRAADGLLYVWTVDEDREMRRLIDFGVDGICTNYPDRLFHILEAR